MINRRYETVYHNLFKVFSLFILLLAMYCHTVIANDIPYKSAIEKRFPQIRIKSNKEKLLSFSEGGLEAFLSHEYLLEPEKPDEFKNKKGFSKQLDITFPRIMESKEGGRIYLSVGDTVNVYGALPDHNDDITFNIGRLGKPLRDPDTQKILAWEVLLVGELVLSMSTTQPNADSHIFQVKTLKKEAKIGDYLVPMTKRTSFRMEEHLPVRPIAARVMSINHQAQYAGQHQIVTINRGAQDGLKPGMRLRLVHPGKVIKKIIPNRPKNSEEYKKMMTFPDETFGKLLVFHTFKRVSYALIQEVHDVVKVGDQVKNFE